MSRLQLTVGKWVLYGQRRCQIVSIPNLQTVQLRDEQGERLSAAPDQLRSAEDVQRPIGTASGHPLDSPGHHKAMAAAERKLAIIEPLLRLGPARTREDVEAVAAASGVHFTTLYRWIRRYEGEESLNALVAQPRDRSKRQPEEAEELMAQIIDRYYLTRNRPSAQSAYERVKVEFARVNKTRPDDPLRVPSLATFKRRISTTDQYQRVSRRYGPRATQALEPLKGHYPGADFPLAVAQVDHTPVDLILVDAVHRLPVGRPWLTLVMDVYSRVVLGFALSFDSPSAFGTGIALAHAILPKEGWMSRHREALQAAAGQTETLSRYDWPCWGKPAVLHMDNAREFRGKTLERALQLHGIARKFRPAKTPQYGGHIERLLGTLAGEIRTLPGATFSNPTERGSYDSEGQAVMTVEAFENWLTAYITGVYHQRVHQALGTSPIDVWERGLLDGTPGHPPTDLPERLQGDAADRLRLDLLPYFEATVQTYGIRHLGVTYMAPALRTRVKQRAAGGRGTRKFQVSYDPRDMSVVYFLDPDLDRYLEVPVRQPDFPAMSLWELRASREYAKKHRLKLENESDIVAAFAAMDRLVEKEKVKSKQRRQEAEKKRQRAKAPEPAGVLPADPPPLPPTFDIKRALEGIDLLEGVEVDVDIP